MKTTKFLAMLFASVALSFTAVSCGDDDVEDIIEDIQNGQTTAKFTKKTDTELEITINTAGICKQVHNAKFDANQKLTSYVYTSTYGTEAAARVAYEAIKEEPDIKVSRSGKTVIVDLSETHAGEDYDVILAMFNHILSNAN